VQTGNADAGVVYTTDAKITDKVKIVTTADSNLHSPIVYPMAEISNSKNPEEAKIFTQYLTSDSAKTIFEKFGFGLSS